MGRDEALTILRAHKQEWVTRYGLTKLGIFGSVARDQAGEKSDVDVVIKMSTPDIFHLVALREDLIAALGADVDLVQDHDHLRPFFKSRLERDAIYV